MSLKINIVESQLEQIIKEEIEKYIKESLGLQALEAHLTTFKHSEPTAEDIEKFISWAMRSSEKTLQDYIDSIDQDPLEEKKKKKKKRSGGKRDGKGASSKGYSLRDWFKGGGWVQTGGKYDGKPCAKQPGQKTKPYCRDPDDRAKLSKKDRDKRARKKRREDPNPNRRGKAKNVSQKKREKKK